MKLAHPELNRTIEIEVGNPCEWVIESSEQFSKYTKEVFGQWQGEEGNFVFSIDDKIYPLAKKIELIINPFTIDVNEKRILNKLYVQLNDLAYSEKFYVQTQEMLQELCRYVFELEQETNYIINTEEYIEPAVIFKALGVKQEVFEDDICEKICRYVKVIGDILGIKLVIFVNLRSFLNDEQIKSIVNDVSYEDVGLLFVESHDKGCIEGMNRYIIDKDLCEI